LTGLNISGVRGGRWYGIGTPRKIFLGVNKYAIKHKIVYNLKKCVHKASPPPALPPQKKNWTKI
jgi:hypothetical protein